MMKEIGKLGLVLMLVLTGTNPCLACADRQIPAQDAPSSEHDAFPFALQYRAQILETIEAVNETERPSSSCTSVREQGGLLSALVQFNVPSPSAAVSPYFLMSLQR